MATYQIDFTGYTVDTTPGDWTERFNTSVTRLVKNAATADSSPSGKILQIDQSATGRKLFSYDAIDSDANRDNIEIVMRFRLTTADSGSDNQLGVWARGSGAVGTEQGYVLELWENSGIQLRKFVGGTATVLAGPSGTAPGTGQPFYVRLRVNGTSIKCRIWQNEEAEPSAWDIDTTDTDVSGVGWAGIFNVTNEDNQFVDFISFGTNGDAAPFPATGLTVSQSAAEMLLDGTPELAAASAGYEVLLGGTPSLSLGMLAYEALVSPASILQTASLIQEVLVTNVPKPAIWREYKAFLRFDIGAVEYAWGTVAEYRSLRNHEPRIIEFPTPTDSYREDDFGIQQQDRFSLKIEDADLSVMALMDSLITIEVTLELVTTRHLYDGTTEEVRYQRKGIVDQVSKIPGAVQMAIVDIDELAMEAEYPNKRFTADDHSELYIDHNGRYLPVVIGTGIKLPAALISTNAGAGPWKYAFAEELSGQTITVLAVYRAGRVVPASEYSVSSTTVAGTTYRILTFTQEQVGFTGELYEIEVDASSDSSRNPVDEIKRLLESVGVQCGNSFGVAAEYCTTNGLVIDAGYAEPRTIRAILHDLLLVSRASLTRTPLQTWAILQDSPRQPLYNLNEDHRDLVEIAEYQKSRRAKNVELEYFPRDSKALYDFYHLLKRDTGAQSGTKRYSCPYLRDHTTADKTISYLMKKEANSASVKAEAYDLQVPLGQVLRLTNSLLWSGHKDFIAPLVTRSPDSNSVTLAEYVADTYIYTAGTLPSDATNGYKPDYSKTPPSAPTSFTVDSSTAILDAHRKLRAYITVYATPPTANWEKIFFSAEDNTTGELYVFQGTDNGDGTYGAVISGLEVSTLYNLTTWCENVFGLEGATATDTETTPAGSEIISAPTSYTATQVGTTLEVALSWTGVSGIDLRAYLVQRLEGTTVTTIGETTGTSINDTTSSLAYSTNYTYRIRAEEWSGNVSDWANATPNPISLSAT